ncbi:MAG: calcium-binding protein, partial [Microcystaceae cyanobacterium]
TPALKLSTFCPVLITVRLLGFAPRTSLNDIGDTLIGGTGNDELRVEGASNYSLTSNQLFVGNLVHQFSEIEAVRLTGTSGNNTIDASSALLSDRTFLFGLEGNDTIKGSQGLDQINGGSGDDSIVGGAGFNFLHGQSGNDTLIGGNDGNSFDGDEGNDLLQGGAGRDSFEDFFDGAGDDRYIGGAGSEDSLFISADANFRLVSFANDPNKSLLTGGKVVFGNLDDSATGTDTLEGIETVTIQGGDSVNIIDASNANQNVTLIAGGGGDLMKGGRGNDSLIGSFSDNDNLSGGLGNDTLTGNGGFNTGEVDILYQFKLNRGQMG